MGLYCDIGYEDRMLGRSLPEPAAVARWHVRRYQQLAPGDLVADIAAENEQFTIKILFPCIVDGLVAEIGERLYRGMVLLRIAAERASVPEGYHYATTELVSSIATVLPNDR